MSNESSQKSGHQVDRPFISIQFQSGQVAQGGINGCRIEDVIDLLIDKLRDYQVGNLACAENEETMDYLELAKLGQLRRRKLRQDQGVYNTLRPHESLHETRTEDDEEDFSATGA
jgi:hypothetical protein